MNRKRWTEGLFSVSVIGGLLLLAGCGKTEKPSGFGNQEKLWQEVAGQKQSEEPKELAYSKDTPALYRDASMGKAGPFVCPQSRGGLKLRSIRR